ncbi:MAG: sigma-54-dependent Fis family transcriptional regulator [Deltaproteobacteria bacterium]|nr:sigma-54-dependent Fis family transcriptional regulator [Deltaproteobacteria bacterium]
MTPLSILVVDDEYLVRWSVSEHLARVGHRVESVETGEEALEYLGRNKPDLMLLDVRLPGKDGVTVLRQVILTHPDLPVVMLSANATLDEAVGAMKLGAKEFLVKPFSFQSLDSVVERALLAARMTQEIDDQIEGMLVSAGAEPIIGKSPAMHEVRRLIERCASAGVTTILIEGESGVGKEVVVRAIHAASPRAAKPLLQINCAALPEQLVESELFGHERGAFTSAHARKIGIVESAEGGTVFLDEIGELPAAAQAKLLQLLENKKYRRVGGVAELRADVRVLAATNVALGERVAEGGFRADLFYRLNIIRIRVPSLRERLEDIPPLVSHFLGRFDSELGRQVRGVASTALDALVAYPWPGNVRELRNVVERALILHPTANELRLEHLPEEIRKHAREGTPGSVKATLEVGIELDAAERKLIVDALNRTNGNQSKAARILGVTRDTLRYRMKKHGLL